MLLRVLIFCCFHWLAFVVPALAQTGTPSTDNCEQATNFLKHYDQAILSIVSGVDTFGVTAVTNFFLQKNSLDGDLLWVKKFGSPDNSVFLKAQAIVSVADGYMIYGLEIPVVVSMIEAKRFILKTDKNGNLLWSKLLSGSVGNLSQQVATNPNGAVIAGGQPWFIASTDFTNGDVLIVKMDANGGVSDSCAVLPAFDISSTQVPNPVNTPIQLTSVQFSALQTNAPLLTTSLELVSTTYCQLCAALCTDTLDLGPDVILCQDSTVTFHAGSGFASYLWQDGSTDSTYTTNLIGLYSVAVTDSCGNQQRDSVLLTVSLLGDTPFPDSTICAGESLTVSMPGFTTYLWGPSGALNCTTCPTVVLQPTENTTYTLFASTPEGCITYDTFLVTVLPLPVRTEIIEFFPGDTVMLGGLTYTQPDTVQLVLPASTGCDTIVTYILQTEEQMAPCDVKVIGCLRYELLRIKLDAQNNRHYRIRVTNTCANALIYTAFELPAGQTAVVPAEGSVFTTNNRSYDVRNPNASPFHSIRFKAQAGTLLNLGASDVFEYSIPAQSAPNYIHVTAKLEPDQYYATILNTFYCPVQPYTNFGPGAGSERAGRTLGVYPNPTQGVLHVDCSDWAGQNVNLRIVNMQGQVLQIQNQPADYAPLRIHLSSALPEGLYLIELQAADGTRLVQRFVVQR